MERFSFFLSKDYEIIKPAGAPASIKAETALAIPLIWRHCVAAGMIKKFPDVDFPYSGIVPASWKLWRAGAAVLKLSAVYFIHMVTREPFFHPLQKPYFFRIACGIQKPCQCPWVVEFPVLKFAGKFRDFIMGDHPAAGGCFFYFEFFHALPHPQCLGTPYFYVRGKNRALFFVGGCLA